MGDLLTTIGVLLLGAVAAFFAGRRHEKKKVQERNAQNREIKEGIKQEVENQDDQALIDLLRRNKRTE